MSQNRKDFLNSIDKIIKQIKKGQSATTDWKKRQSYQNFVETIIELFEKKKQLEKAELELSNYNVKDEDPTNKNGQTLCSKLQNRLLNRSRDFHQEIYNSTNCLIALISIYVKEKYRTNIPTKSVKQFYTYIEENVPSLAKEIELLKESREFRSSIVVHPQSAKLHSWFSMENKTIYYLPAEITTKEAAKQFDSIMKTIYPGLSISLSPPLTGEKFFILPKTDDTIIAFTKMATKFFKKYTDKNLKIK